MPNIKNSMNNHNSHLLSWSHCRFVLQFRLAQNKKKTEKTAPDFEESYSGHAHLNIHFVCYFSANFSTKTRYAKFRIFSHFFLKMFLLHCLWIATVHAIHSSISRTYAWCVIETFLLEEIRKMGNNFLNNKMPFICCGMTREQHRKMYEMVARDIEGHLYH